jgi:CubicO group peptidase (beta-lactamase class C family)
VTFHDLASLAKPLVTATLAHAFLDLDADRRWVLGFQDRDEPLTARMLLCHASGLPAWRPFVHEPLADQLRRPLDEGAHPLFARRGVGEAHYSDLNYRLLAELLEQDLGLPWRALGAALGLTPAPWPEAPAQLPPGPDREAWNLATDAPFPEPDAAQPHDANARAGMLGHAGFGASAPQLAAVLARWVAAGWPGRMALDAARAADGTIWGLGLQRVMTGPGRFGEILDGVPLGSAGVHVLEDITEAMPAPAPRLEGPPGPPSGWWMHTGFTGPALFVRPADGACLALLCHRRGPDGGLLDLETLRARRREVLGGLLARLGG